jgi:ribosomal protein L19
MSHLTIQKIEKKQIRADVYEIKPGYTVRVHQKIKEGEKERIQIYEGLVIAMNPQQDYDSPQSGGGDRSGKNISRSFTKPG